MDENRLITKDKARLVTKRYNQEGINFDESFALVTRTKVIRMLLAFACVEDFKLHQIDVKKLF